MFFVCLFFLFHFGVISGGAQGLVLALHSGISPALCGKPYVMLGIEPESASCYIISPPTSSVSLIFKKYVYQVTVTSAQAIKH